MFFFVVKAKQKWIFEELGPQPWALFDRSNFVLNAAAAGANATSVAESLISSTIAAQRQLVRCVIIVVILIACLTLQE